MNRKKIIIPVILAVVIIIILIIVLYPSHKYSTLSMSQNKWNAIKESREENENLVLEDIKFNDYKLIIDEKNDTIYYSLVNDSKNKYNPKVGYSASDKDTKIAILLDEITDEKVKENHEFKIMIYNQKEYHIYNLKCTNIPLLNISYNQEKENKHKNIPMEMYLFDNVSNIPNRVTISGGKFRINDDGYMFSLHMLTPGKNKRDNILSILNMKPNSEYALIKVDTASENMEVQDVATSFENEKNKVELFINSEYKGVYYLKMV